MALVDVKKLATMMNVTPRRVQQLAAEAGLPRAGKGLYEAGKCLLWYIRYLQDALEKKAVPSGEGAYAGIQEPRVRLARADADMREIDLAKERGQLVTLRDVEKTMNDLVLTTKARIMAVPARVAPEVVGQDSRVMVQALLDKALREALSLLAKYEKNVGPSIPPVSVGESATPVA